MNNRQAKHARNAASREGKRLYVGGVCEVCGTDRHYTASDSCVKCSQLAAGKSIKRKLWAQDQQIALARESFKDDIKYQAWI